MPPSRTHTNCELVFVVCMPIWAAVLASYIGASTMGSFLLAVFLTTSAVLVIVPSDPNTLNTICVEIAVFALILSLYPRERPVNNCESVIGNSTRLPENQTSSNLLDPVADFGKGVGIFFSSYLFLLIFMYGISSMQGLSTAQMGSLGETIKDLQDSNMRYDQEDPEQQPEMVFDVEQGPPSNSETNEESDMANNEQVIRA